METRRNIVPLLLDGFDFNAPGIADQLVGRMAVLKDYNGLRVPVDYFQEAMTRLCEKYLNVRLDAVVHPASPVAQRVAHQQQNAAQAEPQVDRTELAARAQVERPVEATNVVEKGRSDTKAVGGKPEAGAARIDAIVGDHARPRIRDAVTGRTPTPAELDAALRTNEEKIRQNPDDAIAYHNRGFVREVQGDPVAARTDYDQAIRLKTQYELAADRKEYDERIRLNPKNAGLYNKRGSIRQRQGDLAGARDDYEAALRLDPNHPQAKRNREALEALLPPKPPDKP